MFQTLVNAWKIPDLRKKILFTAFIIVIYRIGANIPVPFVDIIEGGLLGGTEGTTFLSYLSMMTGDAFNYGTIFALSITPYINSSIIIQLLTVAIPALERLSKEGEAGKKKLKKDHFSSPPFLLSLGTMHAATPTITPASTKNMGEKLRAKKLTIISPTVETAKQATESGVFLKLLSILSPVLTIIRPTAQLMP